MINPYKPDGPTIISFSGGRTSGFMLWNVLQACGGKLPEDVIACFQNTGLEHPKTYEFVKQVEEKWQVPILWLEMTVDQAECGKKSYGYRQTNFETASRLGEPFAELIKKKKYLPNPVARFCTSELKVLTVNRYVENELGWDDWDVFVGLRADEPWRVAKLKSDNRKDNPLAPLHKAGHTTQDVAEFWKQCDFDLDLPGGDNTFGNCVGCFLKGRSKLERIMENNPDHFAWWIQMEKEVGGTFRSDRPSYETMFTEITIQGKLFDDRYPDDSMPCMCHD